MSVRGYGRLLGGIGSSSDLIGMCSLLPSDASAPIMQDWMFQPGPPAPVDIPYTWLSYNLRYRPEKPYTTATVTQAGGVTARAQDDDAVNEYGDNSFTAELATAVSADAANLAKHVVGMYAQAGQVPRVRMSQLVIQLAGRRGYEQHRILSIKQGQRIRITDAPPRWPVGMTEQIVEGRRRECSDGSVVTFITSPVIGVTPGVSGPWFRLDVSQLDATDRVPF